MRVVSGIQPTGNLHLGNYLGAIKQWVAMQDAMKPGEECLFFLADLHALSQPVVPAELASHTIEMAAALLSCLPVEEKGHEPGPIVKKRVLPLLLPFPPSPTVRSLSGFTLVQRSISSFVRGFQPISHSDTRFRDYSSFPILLTS